MTDLEIYKRFGKMIAKMRMELGLSQEEVASKMNLRKSTYGNYERGDRKIPLPDLVAISKFYEFSIDDFVNQEKEVQWSNQLCRVLTDEFDGTVFSEDELNQIVDFTRYLLMKRGN